MTLKVHVNVTVCFYACQDAVSMQFILAISRWQNTKFVLVKFLYYFILFHIPQI